MPYTAELLRFDDPFLHSAQARALASVDANRVGVVESILNRKCMFCSHLKKFEEHRNQFFSQYLLIQYKFPRSTTCIMIKPFNTQNYLSTTDQVILPYLI